MATMTMQRMPFPRRQSLRERLSDRDRQRFFVTFLTGKMLGIGLFFLIITQAAPWIIGHIADAANISQTDDPLIPSSTA